VPHPQIYKQMKAEEEFGQGQYMYVGSGQYVAVDGAVPVAGVQPPNVSAPPCDAAGATF